jgi:type II secretory pathway component PulF
MGRLKSYIFFAGIVVAGLFVLSAIGIGLAIGGQFPFLAFVGGVVLFYGWMFSAYLHYRQGRQDELQHFLLTAVEAEVPLSAALWSYLKDRPRSVEREVAVIMLLLFVFPGYYWLWHRRHCFDAKVATLASYLDMGVALPTALRAIPGIASKDTILAAMIGESTGQMAAALRRVGQHRTGIVWLHVMGRLAYPLVVIAFMLSIVQFWMAFILPRLVKIYADFNLELPEATENLIDSWFFVGSQAGWIGLALLAVAAALALIAFSPTLRWHLPLISRLQRMHVRARVLQMLSLLLVANKTVPEALALLADSGQFSFPVRWRLRRARKLVESGIPLADSLRRRQLIGRKMAPLVSAAERARHLPWALAELGDSMAGRAIRTVERISLAVTPVYMIVLGAVVCFVVLGMFMPLINVLSSLTQ